ncbi:ZZ-type zinc finger-containing protein 3, partial [Podochytrium sp. JEL0797]
KDLLDSTIAVLQNQLTQNTLDVQHLVRLKQEAVNDPHAFVEKLKAKAIRFPTLQNIVSVPEIDFAKYEPPRAVGKNQSNLTDKEGREILDLNGSKTRRVDGVFREVHYSVFPPIDGGNGDSSAMQEILESESMNPPKRKWTREENAKLQSLMAKYPYRPGESYVARAELIAAELGTRGASQIAKRISRLVSIKDYDGSSLTAAPASVHTQQSSGSIYLESHVAQMADSDSDVSDLDIPASLKNSDEYMELMRLKVVAKMRVKEQMGSVDTGDVGVVHYGFSCDSCGVDPICGVRWKCKECPYEVQVDLCNDCIQTDFVTDTHKLDHDFQKIEVAEEAGPVQ